MYERRIELRKLVMKQDIVFRFALYLVAVYAIIILGIDGSEFSKSSFIYAGF